MQPSDFLAIINVNKIEKDIIINESKSNLSQHLQQFSASSNDGIALVKWHWMFEIGATTKNFTRIKLIKTDEKINQSKYKQVVDAIFVIQIELREKRVITLERVIPRKLRCTFCRATKEKTIIK